MPSNSGAGTRVELRGVSKVFGSGKSATPAVDDVTLSVEPGGVLGVIGYSGAGKSTLIRLINGLESPTSGEVLLDGTDIAGMKERELREVRRDIGMIFQQFNLFTSRTVAGNVAYPLELAGMPRAERKERVAELLEFVGLGDRGDSYPEQLSGGQKQRVGIARALATNPSLLLADEATSALDPETTADVLELLREVNRKFGVTIVLITHEMSVVRAIADHVAVMENGRVVEHAAVHDLFAHPTTEVGRRFAATALRDRPAGRELDSVVGSLADDAAALVTVRVDDDVPLGRVLDIARAEGLDATVAHGSVSNVQARSFGRLTLRLSATGGAATAGAGGETGDAGRDVTAAAERIVAKLNEFTESEVIR
ncbi:methionine ABC transporter ATP-binding protein [Corynebacterium hansenii]|uniref:Methionine ABC transporter ATP-binding protein n=1 Tax=Corynebacterium hansenii TaxID=394964 RepID=A0ABV7ZLR8_9CORY|nr:methionine ABC transporter ATP-binding protein [Corynebacterium hansenii]WJY99090.1 Methionine import ATP-binding protein MetN 2 [Corynebacterium hansenii]